MFVVCLFLHMNRNCGELKTLSMLPEEQCVFYGSLSFVWLEFLWELYLSIRQHKTYKSVQTVPEELQKVISEETYEKARTYGLDRNVFRMAMDVINILITTMLISLDGVAFFWRFGGSIMEKIGYEYNETLDSVAFVLIMNMFSTLINLPFSVYNTFVLESKYGFNKQTFGIFIKDEIAFFILGQIIVVPLIVTVIYTVKIGFDYFFSYMFLSVIVTSFLMLTIYSNFIEPLLDKNTSLPDGNLKTRIEELAERVGFPLYKVYIVEASKRSGHSNAYFYGFFQNKRIVLYDTLLTDYVPENLSTTSQEGVTSNETKGCNDDEVLAVLSHEFGHWKFNHVLKIIIVQLVDLLLECLAFALLYEYEPMYRAFGFHDEEPVLIGLIIVFDFICLPYMTILDFLINILTRYFEFQADAFAETLGNSQFLRSALIKLHKDNLIYPVYDWLYSMWHHSHPPLLERLRAIKDKED